MIDPIRIGKQLFPINRSLTGTGNLKTLKILKKNINKLKIKYFKSGTIAFDWKIPNEYNVIDAYVIDKNKKKIIDFKKNNLHLVGYSEKINKFLKRDQLIKKIYSDSEDESAIPYVTSYYKKDWGFCLSLKDKNEIKKNYKKNDKFKIVINSYFKKKGKMHYGELVIPGKSKQEILISTYICHPSMANNELSGPLVALMLAKYFLKKKNKKSLRFLFVPETIGAISYIKKNLNSLKKNVIGGYILTCIGDERNYSLLYSKYSNSISDRAAVTAFKKLKIKFKKYSFLERGSDERQYNSPYVDLGMSSIMRTKYGEYREYHTSKDNFKVVTKKGLKGGYRVVKQAINLLFESEQTNTTRKISNKNPRSLIYCEPFLFKRKIIGNLSKFEKIKKKYNFRKKIMNFIQYADGSNNIQTIAKFIKMSLNEVKKIYSICKKLKLAA
jgi:aminopeptidase-like protein